MKRIMIEVLFFDNKGGKTETNVMINDDSYDGSMVDYYMNKRIEFTMLSVVINTIILIMRKYVPKINFEITRNTLFQHYLRKTSKNSNGLCNRIKKQEES